MKYIIISLKHGTGKKPMFWRENNAGYTYSPFAAGIYTEEQINSDPAYYNNGQDTRAIPLTDAAMDEIGFKCSFNETAVLKYGVKPVKQTRVEEPDNHRPIAIDRESQYI